MTRANAAMTFTILASALAAIAEEPSRQPHTGNPILSGYYADPSLVQHEGKFYLYATLDPWGDKSLGCWESADFKSGRDISIFEWEVSP